MSSRSLKRHEKLHPPEAGSEAAERYEPDYAQTCESCGGSPTVTLLRDGVVVADTGLCGPCTWGDARTADPSTWNE